MQLYLASKSVRRQQLLMQMGVKFKLLLLDTPEIIKPDESAEHYSQRIVEEKLAAAWQKIIANKLTILPVLCADTEVVLDEKILGKPDNAQDAANMLRSYSGRTHQVITSIGLKYLTYQKVVMSKTAVTFATISDAEIELYLAMDDYKDKAGGYGIQSYIGQFISRIDGCFYSVMGLPLNAVRELLADLEKQTLKLTKAGLNY